MGPADSINIAMEGDSWFRLPDFAVKLATVGGSDYDIERGMKALGYNVRNNAHWGDTIETIALGGKGPGGYLDVLLGWKPDVFLLGGGGNDLLGMKSGLNGRLADFIHQHRSGEDMKPSEYLDTAAFDEAVHQILLFYRFIFEDLANRSETKRLEILVHGYDYPEPKELAWIGKPLKFRGVPREKWAGVIKAAMDRYNKALSKLAGQYPGFVHYVNLRGVVPRDEWHDELHPTRAGFDAVCARFHEVIGKL
jgi:hypothetical protein